MENFQPNINEKWELIPDDFSITTKTFPLVFHHNYDKYITYENGNKILAPKSLLYSLSKYDNINYPIHLKIDQEYLKQSDINETTIFTIMEFSEEIDTIYIPNKYYQQLEVDKLICSENIVKFNIVNEALDKATSIGIKPFRSCFYQITNPKQYLEIHLKRNFTVLKKNQIISLIYRDTHLDFDIVDIAGENSENNNNNNENDNNKFYSIIDTEITVDLHQPYDYVEPATFPKVKQPKPDSDSDNEQKNLEEKRFPGKGNKLGS